MDKKIDRRLEISSKLIEMGNALIIEGKKNNDFTITQTGAFLIFMGGMMFDENDIQLFGQLCSMFSAKKILDNLENTNSELSELLKKKSNEESYEDFIKRINKLREDNDN